VEEVADAIEAKLINEEQACSSLRKLDKLLKMIYEGKFPPEVCRNEELWKV
jgi:predicted RNA-binding protein associated with RNAse of E/G family